MNRVFIPRRYPENDRGAPLQAAAVTPEPVAPLSTLGGNLSDSVLTIRHEVRTKDWEQWYLLLADAHWDNPHCDRALLSKHLEQAKERRAGILSIGDWFCAMQGKADPRHIKEDVRPEHQGGNYFDLLVDTAADYLRPYCGQIVLLSDGNHEWSIRRRWETDLTGRLAKELGVERGHAWGFVRFMFDACHLTNGRRSRQILYYHHGYGGGGPVTRGVIQAQRTDAMVADADILVSGHIHERTLVDAPVVGVNHNGAITIRNRVHLRCSTYKQELTPDSWHGQQGRGPKPLGGWWLRFSYDPTQPGGIARQEIKA